MVVPAGRNLQAAVESRKSRILVVGTAEQLVGLATTQHTAVDHVSIES